MKRITLVTLALVLGYAGMSQAHNGKTAYAIPLSGITIDGKLDDWPHQMAIYPIDWISPFYKLTPTEGPEDLTASFRVGYDLEASLVYLAIVVQDEDLVIHPEAPDFSNQDLCEVYVDGNHSGGIGAVFDYASGEDSDFVATPAQQYGMVAGPGKYDRFADGNPFLISGNTQASGVQAAVLRLGQTIVYEWAIPLFESFPERRFQIELGKAIGFDIAVVDADGRENGNWVSWTPGAGKSTGGPLGDLFFVQDHDDLGRIVGRVVKKKEETPYSGLIVEVYRGDEEVGSIPTNAEGQYQLLLLAGEYTLKPQGVKPSEARAVTVHAGEETEVDFTVTPIQPPRELQRVAAVGLGVLGVAILACMVPLFQRRGRLAGVILSPGDTFREVAAQPDWVGPFFLVLLSSLLISVTITGKMLTVMGDFGGGMQGGLQIALTMLPPLLLMAAALIFSYLAWLIRAGLIYAFAEFAGERKPCYPLLSVVGYALVPEVLLGGIVMACAIGFGLVQVNSLREMSLTMPTSLAGLFSGLAVGNDPIRALLGEIEVFSLWSLGLTIVGVQRVYGFRMGTAGIIVVLYWLLAMVPGLIWWFLFH